MAVQLNLASSTAQKNIDPTKETKRSCHFEGCNKALKLVDQALKCRCDGVFCRKHRDVIAHRCQIKSPLSAAAKKTTHVFESALREGSAY